MRQRTPNYYIVFSVGVLAATLLLTVFRIVVMIRYMQINTVGIDYYLQRSTAVTVFDAAAAFICGFVLQVFLNAIDSRTASKFIINLASSAVVAVCAVLLFTVGLGDSLDKIIIGSIIRLVPGVALTTSIRDFLNGDYLSGTIRIIDAFLVGGCIAIGVGAVVMTYISLTGGAPLL